MTFKDAVEALREGAKKEWEKAGGKEAMDCEGDWGAGQMEAYDKVLELIPQLTKRIHDDMPSHRPDESRIRRAHVNALQVGLQMAIDEIEGQTKLG